MKLSPRLDIGLEPGRRAFIESGAFCPHPVGVNREADSV
jgi:hypothetical protein